MSIMNSSVTIYCDVDGVLNVRRKSSGHMAEKIARKLPLLLGRVLPRVRLWFRWQEEIILKFVEQVKTSESMFVWLTTWNHEAVSTIEPLTGLVSNEVLEYKMRFSELTNQRHKYALLKKHQAVNPSPFIWIDDVATRSYRADDWSADHPHLIIRPHSAFGISTSDIEKITNFIATHR